MIKATDLRIGNLFADRSSNVHSVKGMDDTHIIIEYFHAMSSDFSPNGELDGNHIWPTKSISFEGAQPIQLTPEILAKCGFKKYMRAKDYITVDENHGLDFVKLEDWVIYDLVSSGFYIGFKDGAFFHVEDGVAYDESSYIYKVGVELKYLHELQNRYISMEGEELNVQL